MVQCGGCGRPLSVRDGCVGARLRCPACRAEFVAGPQAGTVLLEAEMAAAPPPHPAPLGPAGLGEADADLAMPPLRPLEPELPPRSALAGDGTGALPLPPQEEASELPPLRIDAEPPGPMTPGRPTLLPAPSSVPLEALPPEGVAPTAPDVNGAGEAPSPAAASPRRRGRRRKGLLDIAHGAREQQPHRGRLVQALGVLSVVLALAPLWLLPFGGIAAEVAAVAFGRLARSMGTTDLQDMELGDMDPAGTSATWRGWILGSVGVGLGVIAFAVAVITTLSFVIEHVVH
jgi:hypothetical protein